MHRAPPSCTPKSTGSACGRSEGRLTPFAPPLVSAIRERRSVSARRRVGGRRRSGVGGPVRALGEGGLEYAFALESARFRRAWPPIHIRYQGGEPRNADRAAVNGSRISLARLAQEHSRRFPPTRPIGPSAQARQGHPSHRDRQSPGCDPHGSVVSDRLCRRRPHRSRDEREKQLSGISTADGAWGGGFTSTLAAATTPAAE
jgi:hypothetical protein